MGLKVQNTLSNHWVSYEEARKDILGWAFNEVGFQSTRMVCFK
jgi:hypothetical protein